MRLKRAVAEDETLRLADVELPADGAALRLRQQMVVRAGPARSAAQRRGRRCGATGSGRASGCGLTLKPITYKMLISPEPTA